MGPGNYAILGLNGTAVTLNGPGTTGNVGVTAGGSAALNGSSGPAIVGNLYLGTGATTNGSASPVSSQVSGMILQTAATNTSLDAAAAAATSAEHFFANLAATQSLPVADNGSITSGTTLHASQTGFNVIDVNNISLGNNDVLTLSGDGIAGAQFVVNVSGNITLNGGNLFSGGEIRLAGGLTQNDVLINLTSTANDNFTSSGGSSTDPSNPHNSLPNAYIDGIVLDLAGGIHLSPGQVEGEIIGGGKEINLVSGSQVNSNFSPNTATTPLPSPALAGAGLMGGVLAARKWKSSRDGIVA